MTATIIFEDEFRGEAPRIYPNDFLLVVVDEDSNNSGGFMDDQVFALRRRGGLDISFWDTFMSGNGFLIQLIDKDGNVIDQAGNYDGNTVLWNLPYYNRGRIRAGNRTSLLRLYDNGTALDGTLESSWVSAADADLSDDQKTYYGDENDISSIGMGIIDFGGPKYLKEDVNKDGVVDILDLVTIAKHFGLSGENVADVTGDSVVNILDLVAVAGAFGKTPSAPALRSQVLSILTASDVRQWLSQVQQLT